LQQVSGDRLTTHPTMLRTKKAITAAVNAMGRV
jgi:hypothetical protein